MVGVWLTQLLIDKGIKYCKECLIRMQMIMIKRQERCWKTETSGTDSNQLTLTNITYSKCMKREWEMGLLLKLKTQLEEEKPITIHSMLLSSPNYQSKRNSKIKRDSNNNWMTWRKRKKTETSKTDLSWTRESSCLTRSWLNEWDYKNLVIREWPNKTLIINEQSPTRLAYWRASWRHRLVLHP